jgi:hypothetical protein
MSGIVTQNVLGNSGLVKAVEAGGGAWTEIKTLTSDGSDATLSFVNGTDDVVLDSTYPIYCFRFINIHPETDAVYFQFQGNAAGGSGYNETITSTYFVAWHMESDSSAGLSYGGAAADLAQETSPQRLSQNVGNDNDQAVSGELYLFAPSDTTFVKQFISRSTTIADDNGPVNVHMGGYFNTTTAIDEIQFTMSSGEIQGGKIKLFGIKDS